MKRKLKKSIKIFIIFLSILIIAPVVSYQYYFAMLKSIDSTSEERVSVEIPMGTSLRKAASILKENRLIRNEKIFLIYARMNGLENIKSGQYDFARKDDVESILNQMNSGAKPIGEKVTIPEGFERMNIANQLSSTGLVNFDVFMELTDHKEEFTEEFPFLNESGVISLEGYLYPDTYYIPKESDEKAIIRMMLKRFSEIYEENQIKEMLNAKNMTLNELITMASVVEREAVLDEERALIAGVFYKRLNIDMPLQSCATVQYILKERKPVLSIEDIEIDSLYNTYLHKGLPPTPIASPGVLSIQAAMNPVQTDYIYFVARGDGGHEFSKTYDDHLKARKKYLGN